MTQQRILHISGKVSDCFSADLTSTTEGNLGEHNGYVPRGLGVGGGDYISLQIDIDTGKVIGWKTPDEETLAEIFKK